MKSYTSKIISYNIKISYVTSNCPKNTIDRHNIFSEDRFFLSQTHILSIRVTYNYFVRVTKYSCDPITFYKYNINLTCFEDFCCIFFNLTKDLQVVNRLRNWVYFMFQYHYSTRESAYKQPESGICNTTLKQTVKQTTTDNTQR